ncbi:putative nuclease HARBI1 [Sparus aurata]|nr:putative nuclease HARBI1 [Sparus aurata]
MAQLVTAIIAGVMYEEAEEEGGRLRRSIRQRTAAIRRRTERRRAILACLAELDQGPVRMYAQLNDQVSILATFFSGAEVKPAFRLSRNSITMLLQMLPREKSHGWSHLLEVLVTLYWLACGASYRVTSNVFSIPLATVCRIVHRVVDDMMTILPRVIHFPRAEEMAEVGAGFAQLANHEAFRAAPGAIDGCHIRIVPPAEPQKRSCINRKLFPSIILQGMCDAKGSFLDVYIGQPGSVHDALVLRRSPMYSQALYPPAGYFLLGDGGYPCLQRPVAIMTPYRQPVASQVEGRYNRHHARARNVIERTFGILKTRWRSIFLRALEIRPVFAPKVVGACCVLQNICVAAHDILEEEQEQDEGEMAEVPDGRDGPGNAEGDERGLSGREVRGHLAAQLSAPQDLPACLGEHDYI